MILPFDFRVNSHAGYRICKTILEKELTVYDISKKLLKRFNTENNYLIKTGIWESWLFSDERSEQVFARMRRVFSLTARK